MRGVITTTNRLRLAHLASAENVSPSLLDVFPKIPQHPADEGEQPWQRLEMLAPARRHMLDAARHPALLWERPRPQVHDERPSHGQRASRHGRTASRSFLSR